MDERLECLKHLRTGSPFNKPCLLLSIICEIQAGHIVSSKVAIDRRLLIRYHDLFELASGERHKASPWLPLWHLRNDQGPEGLLWSPDYTSELAPLADQLGQPKSLNKLLERFSSARLDPALFSALQDRQTAEEACALLVNRYLSSDQAAHARLQKYFQAALASGEYEKHPEKLKGSIQESRQQYARSAAFRTLVLEAYDYRCAASRLRYITPDYRYLVEAAHLIPFSVSQDDRPTNGLALTPNLHWAMDNHLIAPGPDHRWHLSPAIDTLVADNRWLCELDGHPLVLPQDPRWHPCPEALAWRQEHLQR
ncbi:HNH endonuclease [Halomonas cerina]|uniref:Putative restriction endonuclease n=1 Tax=Halomonas cerina TaxID=447424 RepID=A0A839VCV4_9GAMM|nr:HNH endonuclease [Halomonas cerina]MBB3191780.1 putative restriction endonuclease [Halomonas cerina]